VGNAETFKAAVAKLAFYAAELPVSYE